MKSIKNLFDMAKADRYTADGREQVIKAQEAETEDRRYKAGEISEKTGLQKQPDGSWAPSKKSAPAGAKSLPNMSGRDAVRFNTLLEQNAAAGRGEGDGLTPGEVDELNHLIKQAGGRKEPFKPEEFKAMSAARGDRTPKQNPEAIARIEKRYAENEARTQKAMASEEIGKFYTKFDDAQGAYDAGRQTFPEGGYTIFKTPTGQYKVVDDPKTKQRMTDAGYEVEVDVPEGTKPPKAPAPKLTGDTKIRVKK